MSNNPKINIYVDWANLNKASEGLGFNIDYYRFYGWLRQKFSAAEIYVFIGFIEEKAWWYMYLQECGYLLAFKETSVGSRGEVKGNCDAEMVLRASRDYYEGSFDSCVLVSNDGDFRCLAEFFKEKEVFLALVSPNVSKLSVLLKRLQLRVIDLAEHYHKFSVASGKNKKAPDEDVSS